MSRRREAADSLFTVDLSEEVVPGGKVRLRASGVPARYDPEKVRARAEEALGWAPGSSRELSFKMLREALKAKPEKWKAAKDIDDMLRTGDHLIGEPARPDPIATEGPLSTSGVPGEVREIGGVPYQWEPDWRR